MPTPFTKTAPPARLRVLCFLMNGVLKKPLVGLAVGCAVFAATAIHTFTRPKIYEATARVILFDDKIQNPSTKAPDSAQDSSNFRIDPNTAEKVLSSSMLIYRVGGRLTTEEANHVLSQANHAQTLLETLESSRQVSRRDQSPTLSVSYRDQSPQLAARIANLFATEFRLWVERMSISESMISVEDLALRIEQQTSRVAELRERLAQADPNDANYSEHKRELDVNSEHLSRLIERNKQIKEKERIRTEKPADPFPKIIPAEVPAPDDYVEPKILIRLGAGLLAGLLLGSSSASLSARAKALAPQKESGRVFP